MHPAAAHGRADLRPIAFSGEHGHAFAVLILRHDRRLVLGTRVHRHLCHANVLHCEWLARVGGVGELLRTGRENQQSGEAASHPKTSLLTKIANAMTVAATAHTPRSAMQNIIGMSSYGGG